MEENTLSIMLDDGTVKNFQVLFEFEYKYESEERGKTFIAYTDGKVNSYGETEIYASIVCGKRLQAIEDEKDWELVDFILKELTDEIRKKYTEEYTDDRA